MIVYIIYGLQISNMSHITRLILNEDCVTKVGKFFMQECMTNDDDRQEHKYDDEIRAVQ